MAKTVTLSVNAVTAAALFLAGSCGFMLYQKRQYDRLMQEYIDLHWKAGNTEANLVLLKNRLEHCEAGTGSPIQAP